MWYSSAKCPQAALLTGQACPQVCRHWHLPLGLAPATYVVQSWLVSGDQIIAVNGGSVLGKSYSEVVQLIQER